MKVNVKVLNPKATIPTYATDGSGCFDLSTINGGNVAQYTYGSVFDTGLSFEIPKDHVMLIFSRSGHGFKHDVRLSNCVGVIDSDYRGEVKIKLKADGHTYYVSEGEKIAQGIIIKYEKVDFVLADNLSATERGAGGFGSTS